MWPWGPVTDPVLWKNIAWVLIQRYRHQVSWGGNSLRQVWGIGELRGALTSSRRGCSVGFCFPSAVEVPLTLGSAGRMAVAFGCCLFFKIFIYFYWSIIALQCCASFCCKQSEPPMCIHISPPSWLSHFHVTHLVHHRELSWASCVIRILSLSNDKSKHAEQGLYPKCHWVPVPHCGLPLTLFAPECRHLPSHGDGVRTHVKRLLWWIPSGPVVKTEFGQEFGLWSGN